MCNSCRFFKTHSYLRNEWLVQFIQWVFGRKLSGLPLYFLSSLGATLSTIFICSVIIFGTYTTGDGPSVVIDEGWLIGIFYSYTPLVVLLFSSLLLLSLLYSIKDFVGCTFESFRSHNNKQRDEDKLATSEIHGTMRGWTEPLLGVILFFVLVWLILTSFISLRSDSSLFPIVKGEHYIESKKEETTGANTRGRTISEGLISTVQSTTKEAEFDEELSGAIDFVADKYKHAKVRDVVENSFGSISLFGSDEKFVSDEFLEYLDSVTETTPSFVPLAISEAIAGGASYDTLVSILERGHVFDGFHVGMLATRLNIEQIKNLENYGVDFSISSSDGSNALVNSLLNLNNEDVYDYLIQNDELVFSENVDVLGQIIQLSLLVDKDFNKASKLYNRGGRISDVTKEWVVNNLRISNPQLYLRLNDKLNGEFDVD
jgi:hypothetical protein